MSSPKRPTHAFTLRANNGLLRALTTDCHVTAAFVHATTPVEQRPAPQTFKAVWDTGATSTSITPNVVSQCGLKPTGMINMSTANGMRRAETFIVNVALQNGMVVEQVNVAVSELAPGIDVLIGMDIITLGDFAITNRNGRTVFSFRVPSQAEYDYVRDISAGGAKGPPAVTPAQSFFRKGGKRRK